MHGQPPRQPPIVLRRRMVLVVEDIHLTYSVVCAVLWAATRSGCGRTRPLPDRAGLGRRWRRRDLRQTQRWRGGRGHAFTGEIQGYTRKVSHLRQIMIYVSTVDHLVPHLPLPEVALDLSAWCRPNPGNVC